MRLLRFTSEAETALASQFEFLLARGAQRAAGALVDTVEQFLTVTLLEWPGIGRYIAEREIWECWVPGTRLVVWYVFDE